MKNHVTSLELSRKLQELGVPQKSIFHWKKYFYNGEERNEPQMNVPEDYPQRYSAFLSSELGELLPDDSYTFFYDYSWRSHFKGQKDCKEEFTDINETDCRAKLLIHLIEQGLITLK